MSNKLIDIVNISKAFDENVVLDELNLYIRENEFLDSSGTKRLRKNNHCLRILGGFETPDYWKNHLRWSGYHEASAPNKRQLNTVFQRYALFTSYDHCRKYCIRAKD